MKKKILKLVLGSSVGMVAMGLIIIIPCLMLMDFFGANVTDGFVENNSEYADTYKSVLNQNIKTGKGYVSLERVLYLGSFITSFVNSSNSAAISFIVLTL